MPRIITAENRDRYSSLVNSMFSDRKRVFVDQLKWDVAVVDGRYEIDQYDTDDTIYIIEDDGYGQHLASVRFLPSTKPHLLGDVYSYLCEGSVPVGDDIWEVGRGCYNPELTKDEYRSLTGRMRVAMAECALLYGVTKLTSFTYVKLLSRALADGWDMIPLGPPRDCGAAGVLGAFAMPVSPDLLRQFRKSLGLHSPIVQLDMRRAA